MSDWSSNEDENNFTRYDEEQSEDNALRLRKSHKEVQDEESFASQIQPRKNIQDGEEQASDDDAGEETFTNQNEEVLELKTSKNEWILLFIIACICVWYTVGVYMSISVSKQYMKPEFSLQMNEEFTAKMKTKDLHIPFYVKKNYQPKNKEELERLWTYVENEWRTEGRT